MAILEETEAQATTRQLSEKGDREYLEHLMDKKNKEQRKVILEEREHELMVLEKKLATELLIAERSKFERVVAAVAKAPAFVVLAMLLPFCIMLKRPIPEKILDFLKL